MSLGLRKTLYFQSFITRKLLVPRHFRWGKIVFKSARESAFKISSVSFGTPCIINISRALSKTITWLRFFLFPRKTYPTFRKSSNTLKRNTSHAWREKYITVRNIIINANSFAKSETLETEKREMMLAYLWQIDWSERNVALGASNVK